MFCAQCGVAGNDDAQFCVSCGKPSTVSDLRSLEGASDGGPTVERRQRFLVVTAIAAVVILLIAVGGGAAILASHTGPSRVVATKESPLRSVTPQVEGAVSEMPSAAPIPTPGQTEFSDEELVANFGSAVYRIEVEGCGFAGSGSGFAIDEFHIVTNWHVISIDSSPIVRSRDGRAITGKVIGATPKPDVAVIELSEPVDVTLGWADTAGLTEGQHLLGFGYPVPGTEFGVAPGTVLSFQDGETVRDAVRTDAALDRGNSGGPALTTKGEVVGIVTRMADNADGFQNVPLIFTQMALASSVEGMIAKPAKVSAKCEKLAEVPEFQPKYFDPPALPQSPSYQPPSYQVPSYQVPSYQVPTFEVPTTTTVPCPTGNVSASVSAVDSSQSYGAGAWDVQISGMITNGTNSAISVPSISVLVPGASYSSRASLDSYDLPAGSSATWTASAYMWDTPQPTTASVSVDSWLWSDYNLYGCPTI
ncbi:unannotated protein [freshwater metagenome]|uniref:Unannotated protein n=1 Tax=freshwater metagenome TaxID=449393 RepID=A0A6J6XXE2_9ZZZZ